ISAVRVPSPNLELVGWRIAVLAWYLAVLAGDQDVLSPGPVRNAMQRCRQEATISDAYCALAHYIYAQLQPRPPDARGWLDELLAQGPAWFHDSVLLELAAEDCVGAPEQTAALLLRLAAAWEHVPCRRVALIGPASCLVAQGDDLTTTEPLLPIAYPPDADMSQCAPALRAAAFSERASHHMLAQRWREAEQDFGDAWRLGGDPIDLLNWAEALLHQRHQRDDVGAIIGNSLDLRHFDGKYRVLAAFLRFLATRATDDGAQLLELYAALPLHGSALIDDGETIQLLTCRDNPQAFACQAYELLRQPKGQDSIEALRRLLRAADQ
ncbi:MAG TPA: hypothetical protein VNM90_07655, partial [Haliangium sp.]|nr:hypothetical protein [Haliangium sp.]